MDNSLKNFYDDRKDVFKQPQEFKGVSFYPLRICEYEFVDLYYQLFTYPKNYLSMDDPIIFKISYLKFIMLMFKQTDKNNQYTFEKKIIKFLEHVTRQIVDINYELIGADLEHFLIKIIIGDTIFNESEFDIIRSLILRQNGSSLKYVESYNEELEKDLHFINRKMKDFTYVDRIFSLAALTNNTIDDIKNCTLYEMDNLLDSVGNVMAYNLQTIPLTQVDNKKYEFVSYLAHFKEKGRYDNVIIDTEEFKNTSPLFKSDVDLAKN